MVEDEVVDVVVVGGGAAGLSAGLVLGRALRSVLAIDAGEPRNLPTTHMQGYLSRDGTAPRDLIAVGRQELHGYGGRTETDEVLSVVRADDGFAVSLRSGRTGAARRVLVTTGLTDQLPSIPDVRERWGRDVLHCPYCHGYEVRDRRLGALAGGAEAVDEALLLRQWSEDVTLFLDNDENLSQEESERLAARDITVRVGAVTGLEVTDDQLTGVRLDDGRVVAVDALFVRPRVIANDTLLTALGAETDDDGSASWVVTDSTGQTSVPGVYAAGNVADPVAQVVDAAAAGSRAAICINADLVREDTGHALVRQRRSA